MKQFKFLLLISFLNFTLACSHIVHKPVRNESDKWPSENIVKNVPFKAREQDHLRQRLLILPWEYNSTQVSKDLVTQTEKYFATEMLETENFVLVTPQDINLDLNAFIETPAKINSNKSNNSAPTHAESESPVNQKTKYQMDKLFSFVSQKGVTVVLQGFLETPIENESIDPIGIVRKLKWHKEVALTVKAYDPRRKKELWKNTEKAVMDDSESRWFTREGERTHLDPQPEILSGLSKQAIQQMMTPLLEILGQLKWSGRVALVKGDRVFLNVGRLSGLQIGDLLKVTDPRGEEVFDPDTGDAIGKVPGTMKGSLEIISYFGQDGAVSVVHSGSGFQENDPVELY